MNRSSKELDIVHNIILGVYIFIFVLTRANQIRYLAAATQQKMADALTPQTPPKKLFKPSAKTLTPTRSRPSPQSAQQSYSAQKAANAAPRSVTSESTELSNEPFLDSVAKTTILAPLTNVSITSDDLADNAGSDTTGLVENYVLTPADTASRSTDLRSPLSRNPSQPGKDSSPSFKDKVSRAREATKESVDVLAKDIVGKAAGDAESVASSLPTRGDDAADDLRSPTGLAKSFKDKGIPEMSSFVASLAGDGSHGSGEDTPRAAEPSGDTKNPNNQAGQTADGRKREGLNKAGSQQKSQQDSTANPQEPANVSKTADGTFRDTDDNESTNKPANKMGEPNISGISQTAQPAISATTSKTEKQLNGTSQTSDRDKDAHVIDNMGRPAYVQRSIEIPFQRPGKNSSSSSQPENQRRESQDLGDFEELPGIDNLPKISEDESPDPPEEVLDPSVHATSSSIIPIPKILKIPHIDSPPPSDLARLAQGLAGHKIDDVGNIVNDSGEVLGHATGDLPAMVGKQVSDDGEIYGDGGEIVGYVSENHVNPPSPTEIPGDVLGHLRVDHRGNILDSDGNIIGKFNEPPKPTSSSKTESEGKQKEEQKPKVNATTGGSPSDLFLDVKSTTDGIQLTIRIPTTFSRPPPESQE
ncbi:hypothetical protein NUW58_g490 [Xylaria curta]|uniref:Uncharacterized protein n=1 Tax=Xylaria curta TaxID=42375 RepID=A0ACC1PRK5_9PEZI|nr:hypothetical protein NUW58_g490 [Xylaria curta]